MDLVGSFPFNSFLYGVLSWYQSDKSSEPERAFSDFVLCNFRVHRADTKSNLNRIEFFKGVEQMGNITYVVKIINFIAT